MSLHAQVQDYLRTQGLKLPEQLVQDAVAILSALCLHMKLDEAVAPVRAFLQDFRQPEEWTQTILNQLCQFYALADTVFMQYPCRHLSVWTLIDYTQIQRLFSLGETQEKILLLNHDDCDRHLAIRCAQSAWLVQADDVGHWLREGWLKGERHCPKSQQWAMPICLQTGALWGVLYGESQLDVPLSDEMYSSWLALAIVIGDLLNQQPINFQVAI